MRVLVAHNFYRSDAPSGENSAVRRDIEMLISAGFDVKALTPSSDELSPARLAGALFGVRRILDNGFDTIEPWRPDVVHVHNIFPLITSSLLRACRRGDIPVVATTHNYRRTCAAGTHYRDGAHCFDCVGSTIDHPAIRHACYRGSRLQTLPVVINRHLDRSAWADLSAVIALTPYMRDYLAGPCGIPHDRIVVRPTSVIDTVTRADASRPAHDCVLFVGRLSEDKGIRLLLEAWRGTRIRGRTRLIIAGDGPLEDDVQNLSRNDPSVTYLGRVKPDMIDQLLADVRLVILPSIWLEGCPTVIAEAFRAGKPVIACDNPNLRSIIGDAGWTTSPTVAGLRDALDDAYDDVAACRAKGAIARTTYETTMTADASLKLLREAYATAMRTRSSVDSRS